MNLTASWKRNLLPLVFFLAGTTSSAAAAPVDKTLIAQTIKKDVAQLIAGLNAHDAARATAFDAPDIIGIQCGSTPWVGIKADRAGFEAMFAHSKNWQATLIDETVDVASSGELAVYRGIYNEDFGGVGDLMTHKTNFIAEFKRQSDGSLKIVWYSVIKMEQSHPK